jgi:hypothetical protein
MQEILQKTVTGYKTVRRYDEARRLLGEYTSDEGGADVVPVDNGRK